MSSSSADAASGPVSKGNRNSFILGAQPWAGGASDVGLKHFPNQDALAVAADTDDEGRRVAVVAVSDGVSTSRGSEHASLLAAQTACVDIADALAEATESIDLDAALDQAFAAANSAIEAQAGDDHAGAWACTLIVAVAVGRDLVIGNVGDSRAYYFGDDGASHRLSIDDSMAQARIALGVDPADAEAGPGAHAITKWLGVDAPNTSPTVTRMSVESPGWLCVCTDGLWNYASDPDELGAVVTESIREGEDAWRIAGRLVDWANDQGGRDNTAVALVRVV